MSESLQFYRIKTILETSKTQIIIKPLQISPIIESRKKKPNASFVLVLIPDIHINNNLEA